MYLFPSNCEVSSPWPMHCCRKLSGCTLFITGASRGIGKAIALKAARDGANVVIAAKTAETHPKLPGTIYTAAEESKNLLIQTASRSRWSVRVVFKNRWVFIRVCYVPQLKRPEEKLCPAWWTFVMRSRSVRRWRTPCRSSEVRDDTTLNSREAMLLLLNVLSLPWQQGSTSWWTTPALLTWPGHWTHPWRRWTSCWASIWEEPIWREWFCYRCNCVN